MESGKCQDCNSLNESKLGIKALASFYLFLVFLYFLPLAIFSTRMVFLGKTLPVFESFLVNLASLCFMFFLYLLIKRLSRLGFLLALALHSFFFTNNLFLVYGKTAILAIEGLLPGNYRFKLLSVLAAIAINFWIIFYLVFNKRCFVDKPK